MSESIWVGWGETRDEDPPEKECRDCNQRMFGSLEAEDGRCWHCYTKPKRGDFRMDVNTLLSSSKFLKASDIGNRKVLVTIESCEPVRMADGATKVAIRFVGKSKALVANKTNLKEICKQLGGSETRAWHGRQLVLETRLVEFGGDLVPALRVAPPPIPARRGPEPVSPPKPAREPGDDDGPGEITDADVPF